MIFKIMNQISMRKIQFVCFFLTFLFLSFLACRNENKNTDGHIGVTYQNKYYDTTPDAPLDFYCKINELLDAESRLIICSDVKDKYKNISADMAVRIKGNKIDTIEVVIFIFDENGERTNSNLHYPKLDSVLNFVKLSEIQTLKDLKDGSFVGRLQLERFCNGYVTFVF